MAGSKQRMGYAISAMLNALDSYCRAYADEHGCAVGDDGVLGDDGAAEILAGIRALLNGPTGSLDCGRVDAHILELAARHGMAERFK